MYKTELQVQNRSTCIIMVGVHTEGNEELSISLSLEWRKC